MQYQQLCVCVASVNALNAYVLCVPKKFTHQSSKQTDIDAFVQEFE